MCESTPFKHFLSNPIHIVFTPSFVNSLYMTHIRQFFIQIPSLSTRGSIYEGVQLRPGGVVVISENIFF